MKIRYGSRIAALLLALILIERAPLILENSRLKSDLRRVIEEGAAIAPNAKVLSDHPYHALLYLGHDRCVYWVAPRADTAIFIMIDEWRAKPFRYYGMIPKAPTVLIERSNHPTRLQYHEEIRPPGFDEILTPPPAKVFIWPPISPEQHPERPLRWF